MKEANRNTVLPILDNAVVTRELKGLSKILERPGPTQAALDKWLVEST